MTLVPPFVRGGWAMLPLELLRAFRGHSSLPAHEFDKARIRTPRRWVRPLPEPSDDLRFTAWELAHALKKADCARWPSSSLLWLGAAGFLLEQVHLFDWDASELRLSTGMSAFYADFSRTSLAGRIGQGLTLLFLEKLGYTYVGRFSSLLLRHGAAAAPRRSARRIHVQAPDFVVEDLRGERALAEAKGSFVPFAGPSNIKRVLRQALDQLDGWDQVLSPQPCKAFAVGAFLRETDDPSRDSSLLAFVDPPPGDLTDPFEIPSDAVPLVNYASWLRLMGFEDAARRLLTGEGEPQRRMVPLLEIAGRQYVVTIGSVQPTYGDASREPEFLTKLLDGLYWAAHPYHDEVSLSLLGLDLDVVRRLGPPFVKREIEGVIGIDSVSEPYFRAAGFFGSIFSDGSLLGEARLTRGDFEIIAWREVDI